MMVGFHAKLYNISNFQVHGFVYTDWHIENCKQPSTLKSLFPFPALSFSEMLTTIDMIYFVCLSLPVEYMERTFIVFFTAVFMLEQYLQQTGFLLIAE